MTQFLKVTAVITSIILMQTWEAIASCKSDVQKLSADGSHCTCVITITGQPSFEIHDLPLDKCKSYCKDQNPKPTIQEKSIDEKTTQAIVNELKGYNETLNCSAQAPLACEDIKKDIIPIFTIPPNNLFSDQQERLSQPIRHIDMKLQGQYCKSFVEATRKLCATDPMNDVDASVQLAQFMTSSLNAITEEEFDKNMTSRILTSLNEIGDKPFVVVYQPDKSSEWLAFKYRNLFKGKRVLFVMESQYKKALSDHPSIKDVIRLDDASYSGGQLAGVMELVSFFNSDFDSGIGRRLRLHYIVPYATSQAVNLLKNRLDGFNDPQRHDVTSFFGSNKPVEIKTVKELLHQYATAQNIDEKTFTSNYDAMYRYGGSTLTYFAHKFPDSRSAPTEFFSGLITCLSKENPRKLSVAKISGIAVQIPCVPPIIKPYSKTREIEESWALSVLDLCQQPNMLACFAQPRPKGRPSDLECIAYIEDLSKHGIQLPKAEIPH